MTPLMLAATENHLQVLTLLLGRKDVQAQIEAKDIKGDTALRLAAKAGHLSVVQFLFSRQGINPNDAVPLLQAKWDSIAPWLDELQAALAEKSSEWETLSLTMKTIWTLERWAAIGRAQLLKAAPDAGWFAIDGE